MVLRGWVCLEFGFLVGGDVGLLSFCFVRVVASIVLF